MDQTWFEMMDVRRRMLNNAVWIPLRASHHAEVGEHGYVGHRSEFYGVGTLAVLVKHKNYAEKLGWSNVGIGTNHSGYFQDGKYIPVDLYQGYPSNFTGLHLVLAQRGNSSDIGEWHLHQDMVVTLGLKREQDTWVCPLEGYIDVAKLHKQQDGSPGLLEVRASFLKDYLCAREMALYVTTYRERIEIFEDVDRLIWPDRYLEQVTDTDKWEGRVLEIHEGGMIFGEKWSVIHSARTDIDPSEDIPVMGSPNDGNVSSNSWTKEFAGRKLYRVSGALWRTEWVDPATQSPRVRGDKLPPTVFFVTDSEGKQESKETLIDSGRWLWFRPELISDLINRRGGSLNWYTRDTGSVSCSPEGNVHFGVNSLGLINVYAKDIAILPEWQQKIWSGYNISPEGKVSEELLASQVKADPAETLAPEEFLLESLSRLNRFSEENLHIKIVRGNDRISEIIKRVHRFRATDKEGLLALAKDLARLTADSIDAATLQKLVTPPKNEKWGSLKSLEKLLASRIHPDQAKEMLSPLFGIYELRLADAHLATNEMESALDKIGINHTVPYVIQGYQMLHACVSCVYRISAIIEEWQINIGVP